jgi:hypothetical protein
MKFAGRRGGDQIMRIAAIVSAVVFFTVGTAGANDYTGSVAVQAAYGTQTGATAPQINITVDAVYDAKGEAWGTLSYARPATASLAASRVYAHALCVGKIVGPPNVVVVTGRVAKKLGAAFPAFLAFEFNLTNKSIRAVGHATEALAKANCTSHSGIFPAAFTFGYVLVK